MRSVGFSPFALANGTRRDGARRRRLGKMGVTALLSVGHGVNDAYTAILPALLPLLAVRFGLTETLLAVLIAAFSFSTSLPSPFIGAFADRLEPRLLTAGGIVITAVPLSLIGIAPSALSLFLLVIISGLGSAALHPAGSALARTAGAGGAAVAVGLFSAGGMIGYAAGPLLILAIVAEFGAGASAWVFAPALLVAAVLYAMLPGGKRESVREPASVGFNARLFTGPIGLLTLAGALSYLPFLALVSALPLWLVQEHGIAATDQLVGLTLAVFSLSGATGGVLLGILSGHVSRPALIAGSMLLAIAPILTLLYSVPGSGQFWIILVLAGALTYGSAPLLVVSAQDLAPRAAAAASGMLTGVSAGLASVLYVGVGWVQQELGITAALVGTAGRPNPGCSALAPGPWQPPSASAIGETWGCNGPGLRLPRCGPHECSDYGKPHGIKLPPTMRRVTDLFTRKVHHR